LLFVRSPADLASAQLSLSGSQMGGFPRLLGFIDRKIIPLAVARVTSFG